MKWNKVIILGPESTGKSTLCHQLARHYRTAWIPEYAREYLLKHGAHYTYKDLLTIAEGQAKAHYLFNSMVSDFFGMASPPHNHPSGISPHYKRAVAFYDTDMYVLKVWSEFVFKKCHDFILEKLALQTADIYLLCNIDLPWEEDGLREYPDLNTRKILFHTFKDILENQPVPYKIISGNEEARLNSACAFIEQLL